MRAWASCVRLVSAVGVLVLATAPAFAQSHKIGPLAQRAAAQQNGLSPVIVRAIDHGSMSRVAALIQQSGGTLGRALSIIDAHTAMLPNAAIAALADHSEVQTVFLDRPVHGAMERTGATIGATAIHQTLGYDGTGIGVALIDSGVTPWHDDLSDASGHQRVAMFVDFINNRPSPYDDYGHGTHVAGIVAGNGTDSSGKRTGIAPGASLIVLKALDGTGTGRISDVIAALDYALANKDTLNIRVLNLSLSSGVYESYDVDPLTLAAKRLVDAGVVVVAAAGNIGRGAQGQTVYGGITSPGNAPWVLTVGASSHMGTAGRADDKMAIFSSRGPTAVNYIAKPDLVAPGVGIESLSDPASRFYTTKSQYLLSGTVSTSSLPYLSLSGTSMAAPVVAGTVALMLQANPSLTPNEVKAILQYTAQVYPYNRLIQGAGFLNAAGAVKLAASLSPVNPAPTPSMDGWSRSVIWGTHLVRGGTFTATANAWSTDTTWGDLLTSTGANVVWGRLPGTTTPWGTACADSGCTSFDWGAGSRNIVWGNACGGADCQTTWSTSVAASALDTAADPDIVVWGSSETDIVVWGSDTDIVVWGSSADDADIVVWGSSNSDDVIWGAN